MYVNIEVFIKRNIAMYPPRWDDSYLPMQAYEELHLLSAEVMNVNRDQEDETYRGKTVMYYPNNFQVVIENYRLSEQFILIDLLRPAERLKKYRRCGFSTKKKFR